MTWKTTAAEKERERRRRARKGPPTEADRPPVVVADGPKRKPLPGQLDFDGRETPAR
jgi:hypothetical protein